MLIFNLANDWKKFVKNSTHFLDLFQPIHYLLRRQGMQWTWVGWVQVCDRTPWRTVRLDSCRTELSQSGCNLNQKIQKHIFFINNKLNTAYQFGNWSNIILHSNIFKLAHFRRLSLFLFSFQLQNPKKKRSVEGCPLWKNLNPLLFVI